MDNAWDRFLTPLDRKVFAAGGYGARAELGQRPALLVIDITYGFCGDRPQPILESIQRWHNSSGDRAWEAIPHVQRLIEAAREGSRPIIYTHGARRRSDGFDRGRWTDKQLRADEDPDTADDIVAEIAPAEADLVIPKRKPSAFFGTTLASHLVSYGADTLIVCGTTTSGCVRATVVDAFSYDYRVAVAADATFDRGEASHALSLFDIDMKYGNVQDVDSLVAYLRTPSEHD